MKNRQTETYKHKHLVKYETRVQPHTENRQMQSAVNDVQRNVTSTTTKEFLREFRNGNSYTTHVNKIICKRREKETKIHKTPAYTRAHQTIDALGQHKPQLRCLLYYSAAI